MSWPVSSDKWKAPLDLVLVHARENSPFAKLMSVGGFSNGDGNENVKKAIVLLSKTTSLYVDHAFLYIFFAVTARLRRENA